MAEEKTTEEKKDYSKAVSALVKEISKLTVLELSELVNALQDEFGVSAMPMAAAAAPVAGAADAGAEDAGEAGGGTVMLTGVGDNKIAVIKALRAINQNWGLKEAKDMTENLPAEVLKDAKADEAKDAVEKLKEAGATTEVK